MINWQLKENGITDDNVQHFLKKKFFKILNFFIIKIKDFNVYT